MSYLGSWKIDDYLTFCCNTHDPDTGVATDASSVPTYRVYEDETATPILTGSTAKLDDANTTGFYSERIQLTAANGFEKGKCYTIYITATVDSDTGTMHHNFQIEAEVDANAVNDKTGYGLADAAITAAKIATDAFTSDEFAASALNEIADAVWDEDIVAAHNTADTAGALLDDVGTPADFKATGFSTHAAADAADAVWNETNTGHVDAGKAGQQLWTDVDAILADTNELQTDDIPGKITALNDPTADAIADAVWDEALADHDSAGTTGARLADTTTLGTGAITFTYTLTSSVDGTPIASATVWVTTTNDPDDNIVASGTTDTNGEVVFYLDAGTYYLWREKAGYNFTNPDTETVS